MLVFEPFVVVRLAAPFTIPQKISIAERKGVTSLDSLKASGGVGDFGAVGNKRAVGKKEGRGPVRRPVSKKEGRW